MSQDRYSEDLSCEKGKHSAGCPEVGQIPTAQKEASINCRTE